MSQLSRCDTYCIACKITDLEQRVLALNNTQVYFSIEVCNTDFRTIAKANHVYYVDTAKIEEISPGVYFFHMYGPDNALGGNISITDFIFIS